MSVLLEALKKAALEKRTREESAAEQGATAAAPEPVDTGSEAATEAAEPAAQELAPQKPVVNTAATDYLARQESRRARRALEALEQTDEPPAPPPESAPEPEPTPEVIAPESSGAESAEIELPEPEPAPLAEPPQEITSEVPADDFSLPEHAGEDELAHPAAPEHHEHEEDLDLDLDISAAAEFDSPADETPEETQPEVNPAAAAGIDQAEQRRAMQQLISRSRDVLKRSKRRGTYMYAALLLTSVGAIGLYYWVLSHSDPLMMPEPPMVSADLDMGEVAEESLPSEPVSAESAPADMTAQAESVVAAPEPPVATPVAAEPVQVEAPATREPVALVAPVREAAASSEQAAFSGESLVLIERRQTPRPLARKVNDAYRAYQAGDLDRASRLYREVLEESPRQRDALLGAAAISVQRGQYQEALRFYQRRLVDDSGDHFARAGLLALAGQGVADPELQSEVKILLDSYPQQAHLHFLLGSLQAAAGSWPEAQRSFFEARSWDRDNPDYAYNLAVSLEHLRQPSQALAQYRQALQLAEVTPAQFDTGVASRRVAYLEGRQP